MPCEIHSRKYGVIVSQAEALHWTREVKDSEEVQVICSSEVDRLVCSDGEHFFTAAEEVKLLSHLIQDVVVNKVSKHQLVVAVAE